jgi:hypothetical protein
MMTPPPPATATTVLLDMFKHNIHGHVAKHTLLVGLF